ncbi:hypothetical protein BJ085DRAFT_18797 [Dimargaris cristalligena]|uniref:Uncharacterized protein n=1 Tax=Dimargaris cristalligena TaxID=215637 RepID=A0A4P9ZSS4_9FUNG|nr:hypothetical protein BJ085DRAFT_18797 [Dimargaris cristalligena]|eukprot:RKP35540.1 hypothetical protein BJ085DRAFT_18797 [Dimargaris cristalligena]
MHSATASVHLEAERHFPLNLEKPLAGSSADAKAPSERSGAPLDEVIDRLRGWRRFAMDGLMWDTAVYWGEKVLSMTQNVYDLYALCYIHIAAGNLHRAEYLLLAHPQYVAFTYSSWACRYLAALASLQLGKYADTLWILGEQPRYGSGASGFGVGGAGPSSASSRRFSSTAKDGRINFNSAISYLRGRAYLNQQGLFRAKQSLKESVLFDVRNVQAYQLILDSQLLTPAELLRFVHNLPFHAQLGSLDGDLVRDLYLTKLNTLHPYASNALVPLGFETALTNLVDRFRLRHNPDLWTAGAERAYVRGQIHDCFTLTSAVLRSDPYHLATLPLHIACLYSLRMKHQLFYLAHDLESAQPIPWFAVGCYYLLVGDYAQSRRYFSRACSLDAHCGPAWVGFAHSFAAEAEHEPATTAYSAAFRLFPGSPLLPQFLGMQYLQMDSLVLAQDFLLTAVRHCLADTLVNSSLLNELGTLAYKQGRYPYGSGSLFTANGTVAPVVASGLETIWVNLAHTHRQLRQYPEALKYLEKVRAVSPHDCNVLTTMAMIYHILGQLDEAIMLYHQILSVQPNDISSSKLLQLAVEQMTRRQGLPESIEALPERHLTPDRDSGERSHSISQPTPRSPARNGPVDANTFTVAVPQPRPPGRFAWTTTSSVEPGPNYDESDMEMEIEEDL